MVLAFLFSVLFWVLGMGFGLGDVWYFCFFIVSLLTVIVLFLFYRTRHIYFFAHEHFSYIHKCTIT
jgi:hypothetical protein